MIKHDLGAVTERLFHVFSSAEFLAMKGLANEVPIFIQTYDPSQDDDVRAMVKAIANRLRTKGLDVTTVDLFELVLQELEAEEMLDDLLRDEATYTKADLFDTLKNMSDPTTRLIPRLIRAMGTSGTQLTMLTGAGRVYPFLRTHTILESLQPAMLRHPVVLFFPGEYIQETGGGSSLRLFGTLPSPTIYNPYYRATNLDHYKLVPTK
ncbi:DUF1788 domain-containing protein [Gemmatimonas sp.]|uniref:DUF1788 domain-containing protein n=1 Tax=Gemmatimonas sp. TaxID=1962908 RepID=UPI0035680305